MLRTIYRMFSESNSIEPMFLRVDVANFDNEEVTLLALALDSNGTDSPLLDMSWTQGWVEDIISAEDVIRAAEAELGFTL